MTFIASADGCDSANYTDCRALETQNGSIIYKAHTALPVYDESTTVD